MLFSKCFSHSDRLSPVCQRNADAWLYDRWSPLCLLNISSVDALPSLVSASFTQLFPESEAPHLIASAIDRWGHCPRYLVVWRKHNTSSCSPSRVDWKPGLAWIEYKYLLALPVYHIRFSLRGLLELARIRRFNFHWCDGCILTNTMLP